MNDLAKQLIYDLRHDAHTREHFAIYAWEGKGTCGTVGCIAGTAILRHCQKVGIPTQDALSFNNLTGWGIGALSFADGGMKILGLQDIEVAEQLFIPPTHWIDPLQAHGHSASFLTRLGENERPSLDSVEKMIAWAKAVPRGAYNPSHCANALEDVLEGEKLYVDWAAAWRGEAVL